MNKNIVIFKGSNDGISIILDENATFKDIEVALLEKVKNAKSFFKDANICINFKGKNLSECEESKLLEIICKESGLDISFVNSSKIKNKEEPVVSSSLNDNIQQNNFIQQNFTLDNNTNFTHFHKGSLRSGQKISFAGSVVIIGDVNPGGEIIAEGNVIVLGKLKGVVHAGCTGNKNCYISALYMMPTQLIIGDCLVYFPTDTKRDIVPEYAYVKDNQIFVEQLIK
ncbi:septum site-determining protein MinC [uncultured Tyzzerella sp.]|uniref:septum site-determining protein MinC n=1 Tax=uncultured Tyzzerella sp. TaxID=2321398 RepID=UPI002941DC6B|nr:septum site-determining protein MinC [uncultured Tyzzerella sp.]